MPIPQLPFFWNRCKNWIGSARGKQQRSEQHIHLPHTRAWPRPPLPPPLKVHLAAPAGGATARRSEIESTVSIGTRQKIQRILDEGNAIYLDVDPRDCDRILRLSSDGYGGGGGGGTTGCSSSSPSSSAEGGHGRKHSALRGSLLCGGGARFLLDCAAKFVVVAGLYLGGHVLLSGLSTFLARKNLYEGFTVAVAVLQVIWGFYLTAACLLGMSLMWGRCRRSPTVALAFLVVWTLTTSLCLAAAALWLYFFYATRAVRTDACRSKTVRVGRLQINSEAPRRMAPKERIDACIQAVSNRGSELRIYGVVHVLMACLCAVVIVWAWDYRARLLEIEELERLRDETGPASETVSLLIGTAPLGVRSKRPPALRVGSSHSMNDKLAAPPTLGDRRRQATTTTPSSTAPPTPTGHCDLRAARPAATAITGGARVL